MKTLLTTDRVRRDRHQLVLIPTVSRIPPPIGEIAVRIIFPPHVSLPVGIAIRVTVAADQMPGFHRLLLRLGDAGVLRVAAAIAHRDNFWVNSLHRDDRYSHVRDLLSITVRVGQVVPIEVRRLLF